MGGGTFAIMCSSSYNSNFDVYKAFDGNSSTTWSAGQESGDIYIVFYNPNLINITNIAIKNISSASIAGYFYSGGGEVFGSLDGTEWTKLTDYTNTVSSYGSTWNISLTDNKGFYNYYKVNTTAPHPWGGSQGWVIAECVATGTEITSGTPDYVNAWAAPNEHKWAIKY